MNALSDPAVVEMIKTRFVPVATDLRYMRIRGKQSAGLINAADESRIQREWQIDKYRPVGLHVLTPDGRVILNGAAPRDANSLRAWVASAVRAAGSPSPRTLPRNTAAADRGVGFRIDGSVRMAVTIRMSDNGRPVYGAPVLDSLYLDEASLRTLVPNPIRQGERYVIPQEISRQLAVMISDGGDRFYSIRPEDVTTAQMKAGVTSVRDRIATISLGGTVAGTRKYREAGRGGVEGTASLEGEMTIDSSGKLLSILIVSEGRFSGPNIRTTHPHATMGLLEWRAR